MSERLITPQGRASYPSLFTPRAFEGQDAKYELTVLFDADTDVSELKKRAIAAAQEKWGEKLKGAKIQYLDTQHNRAPFLVAGSFKVRLPWRDDADDVEKNGYPEGSTFIKARSTRKPGVVTAYPGADGKPKPVEDESEVYPGVNCKASLDVYAYDTSGNRGVTYGLGNVQILPGGERLAGGLPAEDEFEADPDAVADLSDLTEPSADDGDQEGIEGGDDLSDMIG